MNRRRYASILFSAAMALVASSCAMPQPDKEVWREGRISRVVSGSQLDDIEDRPCAAHIPLPELAGRYFAIVTSPHGRTLAYRTLPVSDASSFHAGDRVWFQPRGCAVPSKDPPAT